MEDQYHLIHLTFKSDSLLYFILDSFFIIQIERIY